MFTLREITIYVQSETSCVTDGTSLLPELQFDRSAEDSVKCDHVKVNCVCKQQHKL